MSQAVALVTMAKLHKLQFELHLHPSYLDLAPNDYYLLADLKYGEGKDIWLQ